MSKRSLKKFEIMQLGGHAAAAVEVAYNNGYGEGAYGSRIAPRPNPYPKGRRHNTWARGFRYGRDDRAMGRSQ